VRRKFNHAGIRIYALSHPFRKNHGDEEITRAMEMAKALGTRYLTVSSTVDQAARLNDLAGRHGAIVALHNHANVKDRNELATPESFERALAGHAHLRLNLDIGHFVAANFDPLDYIRQNHARILCLHVKDRKKNLGSNVPMGQGDARIREVLMLLRQNRWEIPALIENEHKGGDPMEEVRKSYEFMRQAILGRDIE
jgi:sugar phosphate isomerase/epimerase